MRKRINLVLLAFLLTLLALPLLTPTVLAISNPDSISIDRVKVFKGVWEDDDWLFVCEYRVMYSVTPSEDPEDTYLAIVYDENDISVGSNPLNYYDHNLISVYFTASQAAARDMDWDEIGNYTFRISGNPSYFAPVICTNIVGQNCVDRNIQEGPDSFDRGRAKNRELLGDLVVTIAKSMEDDWPVDLLGDNDRLNEAGSLVFRKAIPGLDQVVPDVFEVSLSVEEVPPITKVAYLVPDGDVSTTISSVNPVVTGTTSHFIHVNWPRTDPNKTGTVDSGSTTAVSSNDFEQAQSFWVSSTLTVIDTTDGQAPRSESKVVKGFTAATDTFLLQGTLSASVDAGDRIRLDYSDSYVYTTSTSIQSDLYELDNFDFVDNSEPQLIVVHFTISSSDDGTVYARPYINLLGAETVGDWHIDQFLENPLSVGERLDHPSGDSWSTSDIDDLRVGIDVYTEDGVSEVRVSNVYVEMVYTVPDFTGAYEEGLKRNMGDRLRNAFEGFGDWLGMPGTMVAAAGATILYFILAGRVFVATGSPQAAIALTIPFLLVGGLLGFIPLSVLFAIGFILIILFGITFILARFA